MNLSSEKDASLRPRAVLPGVSTGCPAAGGWLHTRYAPVRHSQSPEGDFTVRLACIRPAASVHPEPGSNSSLYYCFDFCFPFSTVPLLYSRLLRYGRHGHAAAFFSAGFQAFKEPSAASPSSSCPASVDCGCKSTPFFNTASIRRKKFRTFYGNFTCRHRRTLEDSGL